MRLKNIDLFKGLLIVLVILGHILQGRLDESIWRTIIYSFHMPLFIGISGFLFNANNVVKINFIKLINKYWFRVILPWLIAVIIYYSLSVFQNGNYSILGVIKAFLFPFYHLWFIPGFISWVILTWYLKKIKMSNRGLLIIASLISITSEILNNYPEIYQYLGILNSGIGLILDIFKPNFYFFFVLGLVCKQIELKRPKIEDSILPLVCFILVIYLFYNPSKVLSIFNFFMFNSLLLLFVLRVSANNLIRDNKTIEWIGINSLAIYLWHVFPILICKVAIGTENLVYFYSFTICLEIVFIVTYKYLNRIDFLKKYVFGM